MIEFAKIFIPVAASLIVLLIAGSVKLRDMIKRLNLEVEWLQKDLKELEETRKHDLIESRSMEGISTVIDNKIKIEAAAIMKEVSAQRHEDLMMFKEALHSLEKNFSSTLSEVRETLAKFNGTLENLNKEVERAKR